MALAKNIEQSSKYPAGVFAMFLLQLLSMVGFTMLLALLVLYCTRTLGMDDSQAYTLLAAYNALVFASSVFGGYLGERYLGYRYAVSLSIVLASIGLFILVIPKLMALYWGLAFFVVATGIMVPCLFVLLGRLHESTDDPRRDSGFTIAYIGMNVGSFFASAISGFIANKFGYSVAFFIGGAFTLITLFFFIYYRHYFNRRVSGQVDVIRAKERLKKTRSERVNGYPSYFSMMLMLRSL